MAAICGESHYRGPIDVYLEKRHGLNLPIHMAPPAPFEGNERTEWGEILEPFLANKYAADTGLVLYEPTVTYRHPDRPWHLGTPDRLCYAADDPRPFADEPKKVEVKPKETFELSLSKFLGDKEPEDYGPVVLDADTGEQLLLGNVLHIWEGKTHGMMAAKAYDLKNMTVPDDKKIQLAWYRALTGIKDGVLSALIDTHLYKVFHVPHDQAVEDYLLEEADSFWRKVLDGVEPSPDGTEMFSRYLKGRFQMHCEEMVPADAAVLALCAEYKAHRAAKKVADGKLKLAQQEIQLAIGHNQGLLFPGSNKPAVTWKRRATGVVSYGQLTEALRDATQISDLRFDELKDEFTGEPPRTFSVK